MAGSQERARTGTPGANEAGAKPKARTAPPPTDAGPGGPVPPANQPGHRDAVEQDKPRRRPRQQRRGERRASPTKPAPPEVERFEFRFDALDAVVGKVAGVSGRAYVEIDGTDLEVRYGPWHLRTPLSNIAGIEVSGPYNRLKVGGPPRLSLRDRGVTFATTTRKGVCLKFQEPVSGALPFGLMRHTGATVTPADVDGFVDALRARAVT